MSRCHLFVALNAAAFGELSLGIRIAEELHARGEEVDFLAPTTTAVLFRDSPFAHLPVNTLLPSLVEVLPGMVREKPYASVALIDVIAVVATLDTAWAIDPGFLHGLGVPVIALDNWNVGETDLRWDHGSDFLAITPKVLEFRKRLVPAPFARPLPGVGYNALPGVGPLSEAERQAVRDELGVPAAERLVLLLSAKWQTPEAQLWKNHGRLARLFPPLVLEAMAGLGPQVRVVHVGPERFEGGEVLAGRYDWRPHVEPRIFRALVGASDLLLSFNVSAPAMSSAIAMGVPVALLVNSHAGRTVDEVLSGLPGAPENVRRWLPRVVPLHRFRVWPIGLHDLLTPVLAGNPLLTAVETIEALEWDTLLEGCRVLLFDRAARERLRERQAAYCATVRSLPSGADVFLAYL